MTTTHPLIHWAQYLSNKDYKYLIDFVDCIKYNENPPYYPMIILSGPSRTGKSTLKNDIRNYLGNDKCGYALLASVGDVIYHNIIPDLLFLCSIDEIGNDKLANQSIINLAKYGQLFISDTNNVDKVNKEIIKKYAYVIHMTHTF